jgi:hypothetical protein
MRGVLNSTGAQVTITMNQMRENGVLVLRDDQRMLGVVLHAPRGPFYSPKAARSRWKQSGKAILAFCRVAHRTVRCTTGQALFIVRCRLPSKNSTVDRCRNGAIRAPDTVRCTPDSLVPPADRWRGHASRADYAADRWRSRPLAHRTVRCLTGPSGEFLLYAVERFPRATTSPQTAYRTVRCTTG